MQVQLFSINVNIYSDPVGSIQYLGKILRITIFPPAHAGFIGTEIVGIYLGKFTKQFMRAFTVCLMVLVGAVFIMGPAKILAGLTPDVLSMTFWVWIVVIYYILATMLPIDKIIGKVYPLFGFALVFMAVGLITALVVKGYSIPELTLANLRNFPLHIEVRVGEDRRIQPIELNPMRFAGWCTTDIAHFAYGINTYRYFLEQLEPDWEKVLEGREGKRYCLIVLDKPADLNMKDVKAFDYEKLLSDFEKPLELRKVDYGKFGFFGFLFAENRAENWGEIERILKSDLKEYINF